MRKIILMILVLFSVVIFGQAPDKFFAKYGGNGVDIGYGVKETYNRQYIIVGSTTSYGAGNSDAYLLLIDSMGQTVWQKTYGGALSEVGKNVIINPSDSGFVFTGFTSSFGNGGYDVYIVRTDKYGNLIWQTSFGGIDWDFGNDITLSTDLNVIVCGNTFSMGYGKSDGCLLKLDIINGSIIWQKYYGGIEDDSFNAIKVSSDGKYVIGGNSKSFGDSNGDIWFFKSGIIGDSIISKKISLTTKKEVCYDLIEDNTSNLIFCGSLDTSYNNVGKNISYLIKTNLTGSFVSQYQNPGAFLDDDKFTSITNSYDGTAYCMSRKVNNGFFSVDIQPVLTDKNYVYLAAATYAGNLNEEGNKIISTSDNGFAIVGVTNSFGAISDDVFFLKMEFGVQNSPSIVGIEENNQVVDLNKIFFSESTFSFKNTGNESVKCEIFSLDGRIIEKGITNENKYYLQNNFPEGIYLFKIESNKDTKFLKFIKY